MNKNKTVIKNGLLFWTGNGFSYEYPEAKKYDSWPMVKEIQYITKISEEHFLGKAISVYRNYGFTNQLRTQFIDAIVNENDIVTEENTFNMPIKAKEINL